MDEKVLLGAARMVDLERCPIEDLDSSNGTTFLRAARERFLEDGLCTLPGFIRPEALAILTEEANGCIRDAWFCRNTHSVYLTEAAPDVPTGDVATRQERTFVGSIPYDRIGEHSSLRRLYLWEPLKDFVGAVLGKPRLHRFADPLGACEEANGSLFNEVSLEGRILGRFVIAALERMGDEWTKCQRRRKTRSKGGARHCHRGRGGEVGRGGRDSAWGGGSRKRSEGVARPEFPAGDGVVISPLRSSSLDGR